MVFGLFPEPQRGALPGPGLLILRCESHPPLCIGLVWFGQGLLADVIEYRGFFKINVMKSAGNQIVIIKKQ